MLDGGAHRDSDIGTRTERILVHNYLQLQYLCVGQDGAQIYTTTLLRIWSRGSCK